jgi:hypothetical protein
LLPNSFGSLRNAVSHLEPGEEAVAQDTYSFVVRIWQETVRNDGSVVAWRGSIDDVSNGDRSYFDDINSLVPFIRKQIGLADQADMLLPKDETE